ncbi:cysteine hydrolase [Micromonospora orduensis]|uniref:Cysteine hydrolase n=1 Tax=Micromonospora orduensis TaxID=1420891 RepID=A0A5C4QXX1_9ACTN|nr:cysteine hydrolase [Micromonospora orduensis]TNH30891.1 cysteine hydrolase [Micromonospora orduensis]
MNQLNASKTALLIVHLQHDIVTAGTAFGTIFSAEYTARDVITKVNAAAKPLRDRGGVVVPLRIAFAPDHSDLNPTLPLLQMVAQAGCLKDGTEGAALVPDLTVTESDVVITHKRPGPFTDSALADLLNERGIENVIVCGVATNASVEGAVRQAADLGYHTVVLSDASSAADAGAHEASLGSMGLFAAVATVDEFTSQLS